MKIIACVDDLGGMMFNNRRQSRDRILVEDVVRTSRGSTLYIDEYSKALFADFEGIYTVAQNMLDVATGADFCFVENKRLGGIADRINEINETVGLPVLEARFGFGGSDAAYTSQAGIPSVDSIGVEGDFIHSPREYAIKSSLAYSAKQQAAVAMFI